MCFYVIVKHLDLKFWCQYIQQLSNKLFLSEVELKSTTISKMYFYAKCMIQIGREKEEVGHQGWAKSVTFSKYYIQCLKIPTVAKLIFKITFFSSTTKVHFWQCFWLNGYKNFKKIYI